MLRYLFCLESNPFKLFNNEILAQFFIAQSFIDRLNFKKIS